MNNNEEPIAEAGPEEQPDNEPAPEAEAQENPENPPLFALNPGQVNLEVINFCTHNRVKYYQHATVA